MTSSIRRRIEKLEAADKRLTRRIIWEDGTGSAEREIARLEAVGVRWCGATHCHCCGQ
jgi:hypothetical protein